jgi:ribonuclease P protein component
LKRRGEFLHAAKGKRFHARAFSLQAARRLDEAATKGSSEADTACEHARPRFGFTVTKKTGHAVRRNRIRRRLKEALRLMADLPAREGHDYVIIARAEALGAPFSSLQTELMRALGKIHEPRSHESKPRRRIANAGGDVHASQKLSEILKD